MVEVDENLKKIQHEIVTKLYKIQNDNDDDFQEMDYEGQQGSLSQLIYQAIKSNQLQKFYDYLLQEQPQKILDAIKVTPETQRPLEDEEQNSTQCESPQKQIWVESSDSDSVDDDQQEEEFKEDIKEPILKKMQAKFLEYIDQNRSDKNVQRLILDLQKQDKTLDQFICQIKLQIDYTGSMLGRYEQDDFTEYLRQNFKRQTIDMIWNQVKEFVSDIEFPNFYDIREQYIISQIQELMIQNKELGEQDLNEQILVDLILNNKNFENEIKQLQLNEIILTKIVHLYNRLKNDLNNFLKYDAQQKQMKNINRLKQIDQEQILSESDDQKLKNNHLDYSQLKRYHRLGIQAGDKVEGKDIVLIIGITGAGKSTIISYLIGNTLIMDEIQGSIKTDDGQEVVKIKKYIKIVKPKGKGPFPKIGDNFAQSETEFISIYKCRNQCLIADTAGYDDTAGVEKDIANQILVQTALRKAKSIKPILVLSYSDLDSARGKALMSTLEMVLNLFDDFQEHMKSFQIFYNKVPKDVREESITSIISDQYELEKKINPQSDMSKFLSYIMSGFTNGYASIINPFDHPSYKSIWGKIQTQRKITQLDKVIKYSIPNNSKQQVNLYIAQVKNQINMAIHDQNYKEAGKYIKNFQFLSDMLKQEYIEKDFNETIELCIQSADNFKQQSLYKIEQEMQYQGFLSHLTVQICQTTMQILKEFETDQQIYFQNRESLYENFINSIVYACKSLKQFFMQVSMEDYTFKNFFQLKLKNYDKITVVECELLGKNDELNKLKNEIVENFQQQYECHYLKQIQEIEQTFETANQKKKQQEKIKDQRISQNFQNSIRQINDLTELQQQFKEKNINLINFNLESDFCERIHKVCDQKQNYVQQWVDDMIINLDSNKEELDKVFCYLRILRLLVPLMSEEFTEFQKINQNQNCHLKPYSQSMPQKNYLYDQQLQKEGIYIEEGARGTDNGEKQSYNIYDSLIFQLSDKLNQSLKQMEEIIQSFLSDEAQDEESSQQINEIQKKLNLINQISQTDINLKNQTNRNYKSLISTLTDAFTTYQSQEISQTLKDFINGDGKNIYRLKKQLDVLKQLDWVDQYFDSKIAKRQIKNCHSKITDGVIQLKNAMLDERDKFDPDNNKYQKIWKFFQKSKSICYNFSDIPKISEIHQQTEDIIKQITDKIYNESKFNFTNTIKQEDIIWINVQNVMISIENIINYDTQYIQNSINLKTEITDFINKYLEDLKKFFNSPDFCLNREKIKNSCADKDLQQNLRQICCYLINMQRYEMCTQLKIIIKKEHDTNQLKLIQSNIDHYINQLFDEYEQICNDPSQHHSLQKIENQIKYIIIEIDRCFDNKYRSTFVQLGGSKEKFNEEFQKTEKAIQDDDYINIIHKFQNIGQLNDDSSKYQFARLQAILLEKFINYLYTFKTSLQNDIGFDQKEIKQINFQQYKKQLEYLQKIQEAFKVSNNQNFSKYQEQMKDFTSFLYEEILKNQEKLIQTHQTNMNFNYGDHALRNYQKTLQTFRSLLEKDKQNLQEKYKFYEKYENYIEESINKYCLPPYDLTNTVFKKLETAIQNNQETMKFQEIFNGFKIKFNEQLKLNINKIEVQENLEIRLDQIAIFEENLSKNALDKYVSVEIKGYIDQCKKRIDLRKIQDKKEFKQTFKNDHPQQVQTKLGEIKKNNPNLSEQIIEEMQLKALCKIKQIQDTATNLNKCLDQKKFVKGWTKIDKYFQNKQIFKEEFQQKLDDAHSKINDDVTKNLKSDIFQLQEQLNFLSSQMRRIDQSQIVQIQDYQPNKHDKKNIQKITQIYLLSYKLKEPQDQEYVIKQLSNILQQIREILNTLNENYEKSINNEPEKMIKVLAKLKITKNLIQLFKKQQFYDEFSEIIDNQNEKNQFFLKLHEIFQITQNIKDYEEAQIQFCVKLNQMIENLDEQWKKQERDFLDINKNFEIIEKSQESGILQENDFLNKFIKKLKSKIELLTKQTIHSLERQEYKQLQVEYQDVINNERQRYFVKLQISSQTKIVQDELEKKFKYKLNETMWVIKAKAINIQLLAQQMIEVQQIQMNAQSLEHYTKQYMKSVMSEIAINYKILIPSLAKELSQQQNPHLSALGRNIVHKQKEFKQFNISQVQKLTNQLGMDHIIDKLSRQMNVNKIQMQQKIEKQILISQVKQFDEKYEKILNEYFTVQKIHELKEIPQLITEKIRLNNLSESLNKWDQIQKEIVIEILAYIFACWSILENQQDVEFINNNKKEFSYQKPNNSQVIAILLILCSKQGQDKNDIAFKNQLIEMLTGEGKSLIFGILSIFFALIGYSIDVVCYSKYLVDRDYQDFRDLFQFFGIEKLVQYGTFNDLCESTIQQTINIREESAKLIDPQIKSSYNKKDQKIQMKQKILLIDEVDVFFSSEFYGKTFNPVFKLKSDQIKNLLLKIYYLSKACKLKTNSQQYRSIYEIIKKDEDYIEIMNKYSQWEKIIELNIKRMISDAVKFKTHNYHFRDGKIGYRLADNSIDYQTSYGYLTSFAYLKEAEQNNIKQEVALDFLALNIKCGHISYSEIPKVNYSKIIGITGTLKNLHPQMREALQQYNFEIESYIPSIFIECNRKFSKKSEDYVSVLQNQEQHFNKIKSLCEEKYKLGQAIIIFFENIEKLNDYKKELQYQIKSQNTYQDLTLFSKDHENCIAQSTMSKKITLSTREFGRGTDFVCQDDIVKERGVVVIQTFLSQDYCEELQIQGRTARQGQKGSYHLIINESDLISEYSVRKDEIQNWRDSDTLYEGLHNLRQQHFKNMIENYQKQIDQSQQKHKDTIDYINFLKNGQQNQAMEKLNLFNTPVVIKGVEKAQPNHYILVLDGSGSMSTKDGYSKTRWDQLQDGVSAFIDQLIENDQDYHLVSVIYYSNYAEKIVTCENILKIKDVLANAKRVSGGTDFVEALKMANQIIHEAPDSTQNMKIRLLFLSDGGFGYTGDLKQVLNQLKKFYNKMECFWTVGYGPQAESGTLQKMADMMNIKDVCEGVYKEALNPDKLVDEMIEFSNAAETF